MVDNQRQGFYDVDEHVSGKEPVVTYYEWLKRCLAENAGQNRPDGTLLQRIKEMLEEWKESK